MTFGQHALNADENEGPDRLGGFELVGWDDGSRSSTGQGLAIRVADEHPGRLDNEFEFVAAMAGRRLRTRRRSRQSSLRSAAASIASMSSSEKPKWWPISCTSTWVTTAPSVSSCSAQ